jgi:hypothetical protein
MLQLQLDQFDALDTAIACIYKQVDANVEPFRVAIEMRTTIPGLSSLSAEVIVSEIGNDMSRFSGTGSISMDRSVDTKIIMWIACRVALSVRWLATQHPAPNPKKGTQGCIGPVETIRHAEHLEILTTICKFRQMVPTCFLWHSQPFVADQAKVLPDQSQSAKRRGIFRNLEVVKGASDQKRWQILP